MKKVIRPEIETLWCSVVSGGMQLELGATIDGLGYSLVTIVADDKDESLWLEVCVADQIVQIPIEKVREAIDAAIGEVHPESWYDKKVSH